ncbi:proline-rich receptor-like protein kinase PERK10 [Cynara cardunculus var. scolymus]|uniref:proline-rich receptor-like protein kinase PERK10 n=1 Tax=Cynara cardunculus var. scolymus TaxID=59895 RepID=UPI000D6264E4|nr:proline-rich receptor-like protein kinase PERK10 [Cynara cardunculus var. scolymus]
MARSTRPVIRDPSPLPVQRSNRRQAATSSLRCTSDPEWVVLTANNPSSSPPSSPSPPRPRLVTTFITDSSPRAKRITRRPSSSPPIADSLPTSSPPIVEAPPSSPPAVTNTPAHTPTNLPAKENPNLGIEVNPILSPNFLVEGLTASDSSEGEEDFMQMKIPSPTNFNDTKVYLLTWSDHHTTHEPTTMADSAPHTVEEEHFEFDHERGSWW